MDADSQLNFLADLTQPIRQILRSQMRVLLKHLERLMAGHRRRLHRVEALLEQA